MEKRYHQWKKPRLDILPRVNSLSGPSFRTDDNGCDDLWGQDDITVEDVDFIESQIEPGREDSSYIMPAIQQRAESVSHKENFNLFEENEQVELIQKLQEQQLANEGQIKILKQSLEKAQKDLEQERLNKEIAVHNRTQQYKEQERSLERRLQILQTDLQFKEQEMLASNEKISCLEQKLKDAASFDKGNFIFSKCGNSKGSPKKLKPAPHIDRHKFPDENNGLLVNASVQTTEVKDFPSSKQSRLEVWCSKGNVNGSTQVCKALCNSLPFCYLLPQFLQSSSNTQPTLSNHSTGTRLSMNSLSAQDIRSLQNHNVNFHSDRITKLNLSKLNSSLINNTEANYFPSVERQLRNYLSFLQTFNQERQSSSCSSSFQSPASSETTLPTKASFTEISNQQIKAASALSDLIKLFSSKMCFKSEILGNSCRRSDIKDKDVGVDKCNNPTAIKDFPVAENKILKKKCHSNLVPLLVNLSSPVFFNGKCINRIIVECALAALLNMSVHSPESLASFILQLKFNDLISGSCGTIITCLSLCLVQKLISLQEMRNIFCGPSESCILLNICQLCQRIMDFNLCDMSDILSQVIGVLSGVLSRYRSAAFNDNCKCKSMWIPSLITALLICLKAYQKGHIYHMECLKRGMSFLGQLSTHLNDFKELRRNAEDDYVILVCRFVKLCNRLPDMKKFEEVAHELWDFDQNDSTEFEVIEAAVKLNSESSKS